MLSDFTDLIAPRSTLLVPPCSSIVVRIRPREQCNEKSPSHRSPEEQVPTYCGKWCHWPDHFDKVQSQFDLRIQDTVFTGFRTESSALQREYH